MARLITGGSYQPEGRGPRQSRPFFVTDLVRRYGLRAIFAILVAACFAFAPLAVLYWFNTLRLQSPVTTSSSSGQRMVVRAGERHDEQEQAEPGETALLQITCLVPGPGSDGWQELLRSDDPAAPQSPGFNSRYVRHEQVYLRPADKQWVPFGLLGPPPVSVWLPEGNYEILVVHEAPTSETRIYMPGRSYPWLSVLAECSPKPRHKTVCQIPLPHYDTGNPDVQLGVGNVPESADRKPSPDELAQLVSQCESLSAIPTPAGYLLNLPEPSILHQDGHRGCTQDFEQAVTVSREWTRDQIATLRRWLPDDAEAAKARLWVLIDRLGWRQFLQGWFCYALAGVSGLVFTRRGAIALLEPWHRGNSWGDFFGLLVKIVVVSVVVWFALEFISNATGWQSPATFRTR